MKFGTPADLRIRKLVYPFIKRSSLKTMARFVDPVTKTAVDTMDMAFFQQQLNNVNINELRGKLNTTSYGNLAYIALNGPDLFAEKAKRILIHLGVKLK